jgi:hypothetical protein
VKEGVYLKFIFPQNYKFSSKILGVIDYGTAIFNVVWGIIVLGMINIFSIGLNIKIFLFVVLFFPVFLMSIVGFNGENMIFVGSYIIKYMIKPKILLYKK